MAGFHWGDQPAALQAVASNDSFPGKNQSIPAKAFSGARFGCSGFLLVFELGDTFSAFFCYTVLALFIESLAGLETDLDQSGRLQSFQKNLEFRLDFLAGDAYDN